MVLPFQFKRRPTFSFPQRFHHAGWQIGNFLWHAQAQGLALCRLADFALGILPEVVGFYRLLVSRVRLFRLVVDDTGTVGTVGRVVAIRAAGTGWFVVWGWLFWLCWRGHRVIVDDGEGKVIRQSLVMVTFFIRVGLRVVSIIINLNKIQMILTACFILRDFHFCFHYISTKGRKITVDTFSLCIFKICNEIFDSRKIIFSFDANL